MVQKKIIIAGLGSAGYSALTTIKRNNPKAQVVVIDPKESDIVHPCGFPYALEGVVDRKKLEQEIYLQRMNVEKIKGTVHSIDTTTHQIAVVTKNGERSIPYDRAVLCTGFKAFLPPIENVQKYHNNGVYSFASIEDLDSIVSLLTRKSAIVIGAGAIGLEAAHALQVNGMKVTVIEAHGVLPNAIDSDMAEIAGDYCAQNKIEIISNSPVAKIEKIQDAFIAITHDNEYTADIIIIAAGFAPNYDWAIHSSFEVTKSGVIVTEHLEVCPNVYAAGDCIESWSVIDKKPLAVKLATSAYKQGVIAAQNAMDTHSIYHGTAGTFVTKVGDMEIAATGFSSQVARERGISVIAGKIQAPVKPEYFPANERLTIKVLCDTKGKIIGAQAIGSGAASRINIISLALEQGLTIDDIMRFEMAYCPAVSEVNDILFKACEFAKRRMQ